MKKKLVILRRASQTFFLTVFIYILWATAYPLTCMLPPETFFRINPNVMIFTSISERIILPGIGFSLIMLVLAAVLGRFFCGWICPLGTMVDLSGAIVKKKKVPGDRVNTKIRHVKFLAMAGIAISAVFGIQVAWVLDPMGIMARFISLDLIPAFTLSVNGIFVFLIRDLNLYGVVHDIYRMLRSSFLGVKVYFFADAGIILAVFLIVCVLAFFVARLWCRMVCPLGALYALTARSPALKWTVDKCINCGTCRDICRMGAITDGIKRVKGECILCMDCVYSCPVGGIGFRFPFSKNTVDKATDTDKEATGISRRDFLFLLLTSLTVLGFSKKKGVSGNKTFLLRPPGALNEKEFSERCVRCGNCMKVCPTNVIQPVMFHAGLGNVWTPHLINEIGYCEYNCNLCGNVCPTGAIKRLPLAEKQKQRIGLAEIDRSKCIPWSTDKECLVCEEHCPIPDKAIRLKEEVVPGNGTKKPYVVKELCTGCGICQNKCPVRPDRAIKVYPESSV